jgi:MFS family permease
VRHRLPEALRHRDFALLWVASLATRLAAEMMVVAIGWQVFHIHRNAFDLGLVGLCAFAPLPLLALPGGQLADRVSRRLLGAVTFVADAAIAVVLLLVTLGGANETWPFFALSAATGVATALGTPAIRAMPPTLVPPDVLPSAMAIRTLAFQFAVVVGPAASGLLLALRPELPYAVAAVLSLAGVGCMLAIHERRSPDEERHAPGLEGLLGGIRFLRHAPVVSGAIVLDLFAVLFGGAIALLPLFAAEVLHTGPAGLGFLRAAPAVGAIVAGVIVTRRPIGRRAGKKLLTVVALFGASMIVFGLSHSFALSFAALAVSGFADMISMVIRGTTAALATPDELRGRVLAVEMVFISASNELGAFESGAAAALLGAVPAVVAGGVATVVIALVWPWVFPALARIDRLEELKPTGPSLGRAPEPAAAKT